MTAKPATTVLIAHRHPLLAETLAAALERAGGIEILLIARNVSETSTAARDRRPNVVILGPLADLGRRDAARLIKEATPESAVLVIAEDHDAEDFVPAMQAGASGYLTTACTTAQVADAVHRVAAGEVVVLGVGRSQGTDVAPRPGPDRTPVTLTGREREIMRLICAGRSNAQIARELFISSHTVRTHIQNIRAKLNVRSKLEAALMALSGNGSHATAPERPFEATVDLTEAQAASVP